MAVPYYLCDSIVNLLQKNNIDITFYHIKMDFTPENNIKLRTGEYLFVVNYYGQLTKKMQGKLKSQYKNIILDNTQAFFDKPLKNVDTLYSFRKFFGVPDGGGYLRMMQVTIIN